MCPSPLCLSHNQTSFCFNASPVNVHTHVCAVTILLVLLCKELILVWPRAAQLLFAPPNERIINSETDPNVFLCFNKNVCMGRREKQERRGVLYVCGGCS